MRLSLDRTELELRPERAAVLVEHRTLLIADVHLGRVAHMRRAGISLPIEAARADLDRLSALRAAVDPAHIVFLGDLFHSDPNEEWELFADWLGQQADVRYTLVAGNHDRAYVHTHSSMPGLEITDGLDMNDLTLIHEPDVVNEGWAICGHVHPGVKVASGPRSQVRIPCFHLRAAERCLILPAFSALAGKHVRTPAPDDRVVGVYEGRLVDLTPEGSRGSSS